MHEAMKYAQLGGSGSMLFEIRQGMVTRGASISWLSQYPQEVGSEGRGQGYRNRPSSLTLLCGSQEVG